VTVLLPVRNGAPYLAAAMDSILAQTVTDLTLLVVDDGSTDDSVQIAQAHADARTRIVSDGRHLGLAARLNWGLDHADTRYVARMDADDIAEPQRLALQLAFLAGHPEIAICGGQYEAFGESGERWRSDLPTSHHRIGARTLFDSPFGHPTIVFDLHHLNRAQLRYDASAYPAEDYDLWERAHAQVRLANLRDIVLRYRLHAVQTVHRNQAAVEAASASVRRRALERLGIAVSDEEFALHCALGGSRASYTPAAASTWLKKIRRRCWTWSAMHRAIRWESRRRAALLATAPAGR
jgi:glycosyltransferase involved in cell wall biosynthesis